ncbi:MAG: sulfatase-like hydrolase/transferase [Bryobacterales bacterium]|nr:sulfatase-like hydrolase/transferase [Bryobacterales bacterium]
MAQAAGAQAARPNVLLITTDQQSMHALGANGNPHLETPAMDSIAADGVSFTESYCTYPVCSPARSSVMTGLMPHETGVMRNGEAIADGIPNLGEHFRAHGYETFYAGKWHLPGGFGEPAGFERLIGGHTLGAHMDEPLATKCVEFMHGGPAEPFLLVASFMNPHDVCHWIRGHEGSRDYDSVARFPAAPGNMWRDPDEPEYMQHHRYGNFNRMSNSLHISKEWRADDFRHYVHDYYRMCEDVDRQIGRVLSALRFRGLAENTVIALTSDHGEGLGAHRWTQKAAFWEETAKVPLIIAGRGVERRAVVDSDALASGVDILPTLCDYAGVPAPSRVTGRTLRPAIRGEAFDRRFVVSELSDLGFPGREGRMVRTERYKYVAFNGGERPEQFFDLDLDPGEVSNLAGDPGARARLERHRGLLREWTDRTRDEFRIPAGAA